jgi:hypothetical protein
MITDDSEHILTQIELPKVQPSAVITEAEEEDSEMIFSKEVNSDTESLSLESPAFQKFLSSDVDSESSHFLPNKYLVPPQYKHSDFCFGKENVVYLDEFSWELHAMATLKTFVEDFADSVHKESEHAFQMHKPEGLSHEFAQAVQNYIFKIHGLIDDTVDSKQLNIVIGKERKVFIKKVMCTPQVVVESDAESLSSEERAHIAVLVLECRKRIELMYTAMALNT